MEPEPAWTSQLDRHACVAIRKLEEDSDKDRASETLKKDLWAQPDLTSIVCRS